jgi:hypothetical protein
VITLDSGAIVISARSLKVTGSARINRVAVDFEIRQIRMLETLNREVLETLTAFIG